MELSEEPQVTERNVVLADAAKRNHAKARFIANLATARASLAPRNQLDRLVQRNKARAQHVIEDAATAARKGAPVAGAIGLGALLFAVRKPISKWISGLKQPISSTDD